MSEEVIDGDAEVAVIVLAGGRSSRFGSDKILARLDGTTLLDHVLAGVPEGAEVVCVGPPRPSARPVAWVVEDPPDGGPLAGIAAGVAATSAPVVVVVAGDMPWSGPAIPLLLAALAAADGPAAGARADSRSAAAVALDEDGQANPLLAAYRRPALAAHLPDPVRGRRAKLLLDLPHVLVPVPGAPGRDVDTPEDLGEGVVDA